MNNLEVTKKIFTPFQKPWQTFFIVLPMLLFSFLLINQGTGINSDPLKFIPLVVTYIFMNLLFILMIHTGSTDKYRAILFVTYAICFIISFIPNLIETRGSNAFTSADIIQGNIPFCHMVTPMVLIPAALKRTIIFPGSMLEGFASIGSMLIIWIGVSLALGKGFCSWGCFYGGLEDGFSRLFKKPLIKKIDPKWRYLSYAVLLGIVLTSIATLSPTYCTWLCPFKAVTEFEKVTSFLVLIQTIIFVSLFLGLVVILPLLTKKRIQCGIFCPFGAMQSFTNKINAFEIRINKDKCTKCKACVRVCPTFSLDENDLEKGKANLSCTKCGKCIDHCPQKAISLDIKRIDNTCHKGSRVRRSSSLLFLYPAFILMVAMGGSIMQGAIYRILLLITTGSLFQ